MQWRPPLPPSQCANMQWYLTSRHLSAQSLVLVVSSSSACPDPRVSGPAESWPFPIRPSWALPQACPWIGADHVTVSERGPPESRPEQHRRKLGAHRCCPAEPCSAHFDPHCGGEAPPSVGQPGADPIWPGRKRATEHGFVGPARVFRPQGLVAHDRCEHASCRPAPHFIAVLVPDGDIEALSAGEL